MSDTILKCTTRHVRIFTAVVENNDLILDNGGLVGKIIEFQGKDNKYIIIDNETGSKIKLVKSSVSSLLEVKK